MSTLTNEYFDLGAWQSWNFMDWSTGKVNVEAFNTYIDSFAEGLKEQGLSRTTLSFAQVGDISDIVRDDFSNLKADDALGMLAKNTGGVKIGDQTVLAYMVQRLKNDGIGARLSFGGALGGTVDGDWNFNFGDPVEVATSLALWAKGVGFSGIDFDIETGAIKPLESNSPADMASFFQTLHGNGIVVTLTVMGDVNTWGLSGSVLKPIFDAAKVAGNDFTALFDGLNLMLYNGQYYLNAGQTPHQSWDLNDWVDQLADNTGRSRSACGALINVGFNSKINYASPASSGGPLPYKTMPSGLTSGQAAAYIYKQLEDDLGFKLGTPFFWDDNANYTVSEEDGYKSQFFSTTGNFEKEFFAYSGNTVLLGGMRVSTNTKGEV